MSASHPDESDPPPHRGPVPAAAVVPPRARREPAPLEPQHLYKTAGLLFLLALLYRFFAEITHVLLIVYAAAIFAVALNVIVQAVPMKRRWVAAALGLTIVAVIALVLGFGVPVLAEQIRGFSGQAPEFQKQLQAWSDWLRQKTGLNIDLFSARTSRFVQDLFGNVQGQDMIGRAAGVAEALFLPLLVLFGGLFAVAKPNERLLSPVLRAVPRDRRLAFRRLFEVLGGRLRGWIKGTLMAMLAVGVLSILAFSLLGVPYALMLGLLNGLLEFIPLAGPVVGGLVAVIVTSLDDPGKAVWVIFIVIAIQQVEANLITPVVMSRAADVHPFVTLFALVLFGYLFGFLGVLLAIPLVLFVWTVVEVLWVERALDTDEDHIAPVVKE